MSLFRLVNSKLSIFFANQQLSPVKRIAVLIFSEFMAICGGLLGLFMGISALSIIELIYYLTLRLFWTNRRFELEGATEQSHSKVADFILNFTLVSFNIKKLNKNQFGHQFHHFNSSNLILLIFSFIIRCKTLFDSYE